MRRIWINRLNSFREAENFEFIYYSKMTPTMRLDILEQLRIAQKKFNPVRHHARRKGLRGSFKIIQKA